MEFLYNVVLPLLMMTLRVVIYLTITAALVAAGYWVWRRLRHRIGSTQ